MHLEPTEPETDLARAEVMESAGLHNAVAVGGLSALVLVPVAWGLATMGRVARRLLRR